MKKLVELTMRQREYLIELVSVDIEVNGAIPIYDDEVPRDVDICDRVSNSFRGYLSSLLDQGDISSEVYRNIDRRYLTSGRLGRIRVGPDSKSI